jgi:hypothetical protein
MTAFVSEAATASPALSNTRVNRLNIRFSTPVFDKFGSVYGSRNPMRMTATM